MGRGVGWWARGANHILTQSLEPHRALSRLVHGVSRHWAGIMMGSEDPEWWKSEGMWSLKTPMKSTSRDRSRPLDGS